MRSCPTKGKIARRTSSRCAAAATAVRGDPWLALPVHGRMRGYRDKKNRPAEPGGKNFFQGQLLLGFYPKDLDVDFSGLDYRWLFRIWIGFASFGLGWFGFTGLGLIAVFQRVRVVFLGVGRFLRIGMFRFF